ncbi:MAG: twin transmembrane helix small protein [Burkholderiales bacterium]|nr:twin transmembrane helix small protein [Pseudomonadota bacterium]MCC7069245.1 twin transmembrane helix small protein [Burkholderiales bacterium]
MRWLVIVCLFAIVASMASALVFLFRDRGTPSRRMVRALTLRVALSVGLFIFLMLSYRLGWIGPNGIAS